MLRDYPFLILSFFVGIILIIVSGIYYQMNFKQDTVVLDLTETIRTSAISNVNNASRLNEGELYITKGDFEKDFKKNFLSNNNVSLSENPIYEFEYLDNENGATKAIRVLIKDGKTTYQATAKVNIADS